ncbi:MAG TPA: hypothetical protein VGK58_15555 [Lacipirellulaceae bacterium]
MGDSSKKPGENAYKNAQVAEKARINDIEDNMQAAHATYLDASSSGFHCDVRAFERIALLFKKWSGAAKPEKLALQALRPFFWVKLQSLAKTYRGHVAKSEAAWKRYLAQVDAARGFYGIDQNAWDYVLKNAKEMASECDNIQPHLDFLGEYYPVTIGRIRESINRVRQIHCNYFPAVFPDKKPQRQQDVNFDDLLSLEDLRNGVQGVR